MTIDEQIKKADAKIAEIEAALIVAPEHRRELVNRGNLNKCTSTYGHNWMVFRDSELICLNCGERK